MLNGSDAVQPPQDHVVPEARGGFSALETYKSRFLVYDAATPHSYTLHSPF